VNGTLLCVVLASAGIAIGQEKPKDVEGWDKIKWGMTPQEARSAYKSAEGPESNEYWTFQKLTTVKVGDIDMSAVASAKHGSDRVTRVQLLWVYYGHSEAGSGRAGFDTIRTLLIQKYGAPANDETKTKFGDPVREVLWTFPSTSIVLEFTHVSIGITYAATDKKALGVL
jgi:hypothetical protein